LDGEAGVISAVRDSLLGANNGQHDSMQVKSALHGSFEHMLKQLTNEEEDVWHKIYGM
jgi:hypothetical protein